MNKNPCGATSAAVGATPERPHHHLHSDAGDSRMSASNRSSKGVHNDPQAVQAVADRVSVKEAALFFSCHTDTIRRQARRMLSVGHPGILRLGKQYRINLMEMDRFLQSEARREFPGVSGDPDSSCASEGTFDIPKMW